MTTTVVVNMSTCEIILMYPTDTPEPPKIPIVLDNLFVTETDEDPTTIEAYLDDQGGIKLRVRG